MTMMMFLLLLLLMMMMMMMMVIMMMIPVVVRVLKTLVTISKTETVVLVLAYPPIR